MTTRTKLPDTFDPDDLELLRALPRRLLRAGYCDAYTLYGPLNLRVNCWAEDVELLPAELATLFRLFLLGEAVGDPDAASALGSDMVAALERLGVLLRGDRGVRSGNLVLIPAHGYLLLAERPGVDPVAYFGDDSAALAAHLMPGRGDRCLDLCTGPGIQAMVVGGRARHVIGVELNPIAAAHAELNMVMNRLDDVVEVRIGDLYAAVDGMRFDFISANPPLLPFVPDLPYPFVGHGGGDGLDVVRRILAGLDRALAPGGVCQLLGTCLGTWDAPLCIDELRRLADGGPWNIHMTLPTALALVPGATMFDGLAHTCAMAAGLDLDGVRSALERHLGAQGASHLYLYFLVVSRADSAGRFSMTRHFERRVGFWFIS